MRNLIKKLTSLLPLLFLSNTISEVSHAYQAKGTTTNFISNSDGRSPDTFRLAAKNGVVAAAHPLASQAGIQMLKLGGNAADAAVATSFAISVLRPQSTGIGGGGFLLYWDSKTKKATAFDFRERAPGRATRDMYVDKSGKPLFFTYKSHVLPNASVNGHLAVGVPGVVAGLIKLHKDHGSLPLKTIMQPAIKLAAEGFQVYPSLSRAIKNRIKVLRAFEGSRKLFLPNGKPLRPEQKLIQSDLANTLKLIASKGHDGFYTGKVRDGILAEMQRGGGIVSKKDFADYKVKMRTPISGNYRGHEILSMPPPSSGGIHILQILNILKDDKVGRLGHNTVKGAHLLAEAMRRAFADRAAYLGDPEFVKIPIRGLVSPKYAKSVRQTIDLNKASSSAKIKKIDPLPYESSSTTHMSIVDKWGNAISSTQTVNYVFGSGVVAQGTGIVLNDEMDDFSISPGQPNAYGLLGGEANAIAAKKTMLSSMSPTIVLNDKKEIELILGSPGGPRIITATLQTIINTIDHQMPLLEAVHAARIHHQWFPDEIRVEAGGLTDAVVKGLEKMGHKITVKGSIGDVQAIGRSKDQWIGVSDSRSDGRPVGY